MNGKVVLITGSTDGHGRGLAGECSRAGATVLVHGRDEERIAATMDELPGEAHAYRGDFASLPHVRRLAEDILDREQRLDVLVNNAGIGFGSDKRELSDDGYELRFAVNYLAGYLLTRELLPLLERSAPARIVNVASAGQWPIDFDDVMLEHGYSGVRAYCQSKLAQIMHAIDLSESLDPARGTANALHPATYMPTKMVKTPMSSLEEGVEATMRLVADPALAGVSGKYFDGKREAAADSQAYDEAARASLRELSERLVAGA